EGYPRVPRTLEFRGSLRDRCWSCIERIRVFRRSTFARSLKANRCQFEADATAGDAVREPVYSARHALQQPDIPKLSKLGKTVSHAEPLFTRALHLEGFCSAAVGSFLQSLDVSDLWPQQCRQCRAMRATTRYGGIKINTPPSVWKLAWSANLPGTFTLFEVILLTK